MILDAQECFHAHPSPLVRSIFSSLKEQKKKSTEVTIEEIGQDCCYDIFNISVVICQPSREVKMTR